MKNSKLKNSLNKKLSPLIYQNQSFLNKLSQSVRSRKKIKLLLQEANNEELLCLVEGSLNLLKGRLPLTKRQLSAMKKQSQTLRKLARARSATTTRNLLLNGIEQRGNGLPLVAPLLAGVILPLITETLVSKFL